MRKPPQSVSKHKPANETDEYKQKVDQIQKDFSLLVTKLRSHGIHLPIDPEPQEGEEA